MKILKLLVFLLLIVTIYSCTVSESTTALNNNLSNQTTTTTSTSTNETSTENITSQLTTDTTTITEISTSEITTSTSEDNNILTISEVILMSNEELVKTKGIVTKIATDKLLYIEDEHASMSIYGYIQGVKVGDEIIVVGIKSNYNGSHQIIDFTLEVISEGNSLSAAIDLDINFSDEDLIIYQGRRFNYNSLILHSIEQDTYGNLTFVLEDMNTNRSYNGRFDYRLDNSSELVTYLKSLEDRIIYISNIIMGWDNGPLFHFTEISELGLVE